MDLVPWGFPCNRTEGGMHTGKGDEMNVLSSDDRR
jgi:hypothetical protein